MSYVLIRVTYETVPFRRLGTKRAESLMKFRRIVSP